MIEKQNYEITLMCDHCDDELGRFFDAEDDFKPMIAFAKSMGWQIFKDKAGDWTHHCRECVEEKTVTNDIRQMNMFEP